MPICSNNERKHNQFLNNSHAENYINFVVCFTYDPTGFNITAKIVYCLFYLIIIMLLVVQYVLVHMFLCSFA